MSEFKLPHEKDFRTDSNLCGYLTENAAAIEQAFNDLDKRITKLEDEKREGIDIINDMFNM